MRVPLRVRALPCRTPWRRARRQPSRSNGPPAKHQGRDAASPEKPEPGMVEVVVVELIDPEPGAARGQKWIERALLEKRIHARSGLVAEVPADDPGIRLWIVGLADLAPQQELGVRHGECSEQDDIAGLTLLLACQQIDIPNCDHTPGLRVVLQAQHMTMQACLKAL